MNNNTNRHINDECLVKMAKKTEGSAYAQNLELSVAYDEVDNSFIVVGTLSHTAIQVTPMTKPYIHENVPMQTIIGTRQIVKKGTHDILLVSAGLAIGSKKSRKVVTNYLRNKEFYLIQTTDKKGNPIYDVVIKVVDHYESMTRPLNASSQRAEYPLTVVEKPALMAGSSYTDPIREDVIAFGGKAGCVLNSSSQGRKIQMTMYKNNTRKDVNKFLDILNNATNNEFNLRKGDLVNGKGLADANTRISSKSTAVALNKESGCRVDTFVFLFDADDNLDGSADLSAECLARNFCRAYHIDKKYIPHYTELFLGYLVQCRPQTSKVAAYVASRKSMEQRLEGKRIFTYDIVNAENPAITREVLMMLHKNKRNKKKLVLLKGYDGVRICLNGTDKPDDYIGDTNAVKDVFDITKPDGINILNIAHFCDEDSEGWFKAHTCAQFLKTVIRVVKDSTVEGIRERYYKAMMHIVEETFTKDTDFSCQTVRRPHWEKIEDTYLSGFARQINPHGMEKYPSMLRAGINDAKQRMMNRIIGDRYDCPGHAAMITADIIYRYYGIRILEIVDGHFEVFDPTFNRYAKEFEITDKRGLMEKNPAMGTLETGKLWFVSDEEMCERIKLYAETGALLPSGRPFNEEDVENCVNIIHTFKEGAMMIPAHLEAIARIEAGLDEDGDKGVVHFPRKDGEGLVEIVWDAGFNPRAVDINPAGTASDDKTPYGVNAYQEQMAAMIDLGNHGVGIITNQFRIIVEGLLLDKDDEDGKNWFVGLFVNVFKMQGNEMYVSQFSEADETLTVDEFGFKVYHTKGTIVDDVQAAIAKSAPTWENVLAALDDLDIVGRHCQELTIDAQKKFFQVVITFMDAMKKAGYNILPLCCGVDLNMNWKNSEAGIEIINKPSRRLQKMAAKLESTDPVIAGYIREDGVVTAHICDELSDKVRNDAFGEIRCAALEVAIEKLENLRKTYFELVLDKQKQAERTAAYVDAKDYLRSKGADIRIDAAINTAKHCDHIYREYVRAMRTTHLANKDWMSEQDIAEVERLIRASAKQTYAEMMAELDNEIRCAAENVPPEILIAYINGGDEIFNGFLGKLLVPETMYYLAKTAERPYAYEELPVSGEDINLAEEAGFGIVNNRVLYVSGEPLCMVPEAVEDGRIKIVCEDDKVFAVRPLADFVEIPKADYSKVVLNIQLKTCLYKDETGAWQTDDVKQAENELTISNFKAIVADTPIQVRKVPVPGKYGIYDFVVFAGTERLGIVHLPKNSFRFFNGMYDGLCGKFSSIWSTADAASMFVSLKDCKIEELGDMAPEAETVFTDKTLDDGEDLGDDFLLF